jgi:hypothetical protein
MLRWKRLSTLVLSALVVAGACLAPGLSARANAAPSPEGFGATTRGGAGQTVYRVTHLGDAGPGSLRDAVYQGSRYITFSVAGEIKLSRDIMIKGAYLTIDGLSAPSPGITIRNHGLIVEGSLGAHDIIIRGLRIRTSLGCDTCGSGQTGSGIIVSSGAYNVLVDRVSIQGTADQAISVVKGAHDVTIQWSIFAQHDSSDGLPVLVGYKAQRVSLHHNLLTRGYERLPQAMWADDGTQATDTQVDMRNNLVWNWGYAGSQIWKGTKSNLVNNYYHDPNASENGKKRAVYVCHAKSTAPQCDGKNPKLYGRAYIAGNVSGHGSTYTNYLNSLGTESYAFSAPSVTTTDACTAAQQVLVNAGMRPLDTFDQQYVSEVKLEGCATTPPPSPPPTSELPVPDNPLAEADLLEAEDYASKSSNVWLQTGQGEHGGDAIGMSHGAWTGYGPFMIGAYGKVNIRVASGNKGGTITFRSGSATGTTLGTINVPNTGGWSSWTTMSTSLKPTAGSQLLYLTFSNSTTGAGQMMLLDRLEFVPVEPIVAVFPAKIEAVKYTAKSSNLWVQNGQAEDSGNVVGMSHGAWAGYGPLKLDGYSKLNLRTASGNKGGTIVVRTGSKSGPVIGSLTVPNTGGWSQWSTYTASIAPSKGTQEVYFTFSNSTTGGGQMMLVDWFELRP